MEIAFGAPAFSRHSSFWRRRRVFRRGTVNHENLSDVLNGRGFEFLADLQQQCISHITVGFSRSNLDQLMRIKTRCDFVHYGVGKPFVTDMDDRVQSMCAGTQSASLGGCQIEQVVPPAGIVG